jgi:hypothetical protein
MTWLTIVECLSYRWPRRCPVCRSHNSVPLHSSPNMTDRRDFNIINTACATRTAYPSEAPRFTHCFEWDLCSLIFLCSVLCAIVRFFCYFSFDRYCIDRPSSVYASDNFFCTLNTLLKRIYPKHPNSEVTTPYCKVVVYERPF